MHQGLLCLDETFWCVDRVFRLRERRLTVKPITALSSLTSRRGSKLAEAHELQGLAALFTLIVVIKMNLSVSYHLCGQNTEGLSSYLHLILSGHKNDH